MDFDQQKKLTSLHLHVNQDLPDLGHIAIETSSVHRK